MATWWSDTNITSQNEKFTLSEDMKELQVLRGGWGNLKFITKFSLVLVS